MNNSRNFGDSAEENTKRLKASYDAFPAYQQKALDEINNTLLQSPTIQEFLNMIRKADVIKMKEGIYSLDDQMKEFLQIPQSMSMILEGLICSSKIDIENNNAQFSHTKYFKSYFHKSCFLFTKEKMPRIKYPYKDVFINPRTFDQKEYEFLSEERYRGMYDEALAFLKQDPVFDDLYNIMTLYNQNDDDIYTILGRNIDFWQNPYSSSHILLVIGHLYRDKKIDIEQYHSMRKMYSEVIKNMKTTS
jgi:hypothetical protein